MTKQKEIVQWSYDFIQNYYLNNTETITDQERTYLSYLSPFAEKYFGPTNPALLFGGVDVAQLMKKNLWTIRDGLIPLSMFFRDNTLKPEKVKLMIHKDLWFIVPEEWRESVTYYDIVANTTYSQKNPPQRLIIMGSPNETLADPDEFAEDIEFIAKSLGKKNIDGMEIIGYFPNKRTDLWGRWQDENIFGYAKILFKEFKLDIKFPEWQILKNEINLKNSMYCEINRGHFIKDTFPLHLFLSRGAGLLKTEVEKEPLVEVNSIPLSLYHRMKIYKLDEKNCPKYIDPLSDQQLPYLRKIIEKGTNPRNIGAGWEKWYGTYIKRYYKNIELN